MKGYSVQQVQDAAIRLATVAILLLAAVYAQILLVQLGLAKQGWNSPLTYVFFLASLALFAWSVYESRSRELLVIGAILLSIAALLLNPGMFDTLLFYAAGLAIGLAASIIRPARRKAR